jgi:hypothetical protein
MACPRPLHAILGLLLITFDGIEEAFHSSPEYRIIVVHPSEICHHSRHHLVPQILSQVSSY